MRIGQVERTSWGNCPNICALSGPCGFVVWLFASQNDLPDRAPDQRKCGRHFAYDWTTMRITRHRAAWVRSWPGLGRISVKNDVSRTAIESIRLIREYGRMAAMELPHDRNF